MNVPASPPAGLSGTRRQRVIVWVTLFAAPVIWVAYMLLCVNLVSTACAGGIAQHHAPKWETVERIVTAASVAAFVVCLALAVATGRAWRQIVSLVPARRDPIRFVVWCSVTAAVAFTVGLAFTTSVLVAMPIDRLCGPFR
jgi:heme/copper-type cytochrome/quinol oxidase subunit 2